jgi:hypothetical protein
MVCRSVSLALCHGKRIEKDFKSSEETNSKDSKRQPTSGSTGPLQTDRRASQRTQVKAGTSRFKGFCFSQMVAPRKNT